MQHTTTCWGLCIADIHSMCHGVHNIIRGRHCFLLSDFRISLEATGFSSARVTLICSLEACRCSLALRAEKDCYLNLDSVSN